MHSIKEASNLIPPHAPVVGNTAQTGAQPILLAPRGKSLIPVISVLGTWADQNEEHLRAVVLKR